MPEELNSNSEELDVDKLVESAETGESSEETETKTEETPKAEPAKAEYNHDAETLEFFKSVRAAVGGKRFDGLMSAWQRDRGKLKTYEEKPTEAKSETSDDALIDYLDKKLEEKRIAKERAVQEAVEKECSEVRTVYPQFSEKQLFETANELSSEGRPASLMTAAIHLAKIEQAIQAKGKLAAEEIEKKNKAGTIAGRSGLQTGTGIKNMTRKRMEKRP